MKRFYFLLSALFMLLSSPSFGQITITRANAFPPGTSIIGQSRTVQTFESRTDTAGIRALINRSGANQTWDLRAGGRVFVSTPPVSRRYFAPSSISGVTVSGANLAIRTSFAGSDTATVLFANLTDSELQTISAGSVLTRTNAFLGTTQTYTPPIPTLRFPLTSTSTWNGSTQLSTQVPGFGALVTNLNYTYAVDGWGTLITPANPNGVPVLRLRSTFVLTVTGFPLPPTTAVTYLFLDANANALATIQDAPTLSAGIPDVASGMSVSYSTFTPLSVRELGGEKPAAFALEQNYPNPFNPSTLIRYSLPSTEQVSLKVFDMLGREVAVLVNARQAAGRYEVSFNAMNLPSGLYFYRLQAGSYSETRKMMLIR